jgi:hypothetical protein
MDAAPRFTAGRYRGADGTAAFVISDHLPAGTAGPTHSAPQRSTKPQPGCPTKPSTRSADKGSPYHESRFVINPSAM